MAMVRQSRGAPMSVDEFSAASRSAHHLTRIDASRNMARWYALSVELTLFDDWACRRAHGRIGGRGGRIMLGLFGTKREAEAKLHAILRHKLTRGYRPG
jgi:predicted DNA-binding WGR domain protein